MSRSPVPPPMVSRGWRLPATRASASRRCRAESRRPTPRPAAGIGRRRGREHEHRRPDRRQQGRQEEAVDLVRVGGRALAQRRRHDRLYVGRRRLRPTERGRCRLQLDDDRRCGSRDRQRSDQHEERRGRGREQRYRRPGRRQQGRQEGADLPLCCGPEQLVADGRDDRVYWSGRRLWARSRFGLELLARHDCRSRCRDRNASTGTKTLTDGVGHTTTAPSISGIKVDKKAPSLIRRWSDDITERGRLVQDRGFEFVHRE